MAELENNRPDLTGKKLGGVVLHRHIASGGFGDVYISEDFNICVKVLFRQSFSAPELFDREVNDVKFISSCIRGYCGICKFFGGGNFSLDEPFEPFAGRGVLKSTEYKKFPVVPVRLGDDKIADVFYYLLMAADNLSDEPGEYIPDTLGNRGRYGLLASLSLDQKSAIIAQLIDSLLFMYQRIAEHISETDDLDENSLRAAHGDIKPENIFFVNGNAMLGDIGASMQINDELPSGVGTPFFRPTEVESKLLMEKCNGDFFAYAVFCDIFALGKVTAYLLANGEPDEECWENHPLVEIKNQLLSFHCKEDITSENVVEKLKYLRNRSFPYSNKFLEQSCYARRAPLIEVADAQEFFSCWQITETIKEDVFFVRKPSFVWNGIEDILLARVWRGTDVEKKIRAGEGMSFRKKIREQRPVLIYKIGNTGEYIVLSHSSKKVSPESAGSVEDI